MASQPQAQAARESTKKEDEPLVYSNSVSTDPMLRDAVESAFSASTGDAVLDTTYEDWAEFAVGEDLINNPLSTLHEATNVVRQKLGYDDISVMGRIPNHKRIEDLRSEDIDTLVSIDVRCTDATDVYTVVRLAVFKCRKCGAINSAYQTRSSGALDKPHECHGENGDCNGGPRAMEFQQKLSTKYMLDTQQVILQDLHTLATTANPHDIKANLHLHHVLGIAPGERATVTAIVRAVEHAEKEAKLYLQIVGIEPKNRDFSALDLTDDEIERIEEIADSEDPYGMLSSSIAPKIQGESYKLAKKGALYQLVGGVDHSTPGDYSRSVIHMSYVGDSGRGKSKIAKYTAEVAPNAEYKSADNVTEVGLTAAVTHEERFDESKWTLSGGCLVRADGGHAVIDELDKAPESIQNSLQEPLSEGRVSVAKSKIQAELPARCSTLLIANPEDGRFDLYRPLSEQIPINPAIWDRMDIIVPFYDSSDEEEDDAIASGILDAAQGNVEPEVSKEMLRAYIAHARTFDPELTTEARDAIEMAWKDLRNRTGDERVTIGARQMESMVRISEASARIRLSDTVDVADVERAVSIMEAWMSLLMTDENGNWDIDAVKGLAAAKRKPKNEFWRVMNALSETHGDEVPREEVIEMLMDRLDENRGNVQNIINGATGRGDAEYDKEEGVLRDTR